MAISHGGAVWGASSSRVKASAQEQLEEARQNLLQSQPSMPDGFEAPPAGLIPSQSPGPFPLEPLNGLPIDFDAYRLGPGDSFYVNVEGFPEVNFQ